MKNVGVFVLKQLECVRGGLAAAQVQLGNSFQQSLIVRYVTKLSLVGCERDVSRHPMNAKWPDKSLAKPTNTFGTIMGAQNRNQLSFRILM
jgi:hypothetical protein